MARSCFTIAIWGQVPSLLLAGSLGCSFTVGTSPELIRRDTAPTTAPSNPATEPAATRPVSWYSKINRRPDPLEQEFTRQDPSYDPAALFLRPSYSNPNLSREQAYEALLTTTTFQDTAVGASAITPGQAWAFVTLLQQPDARDAFDDLLKRGQIGGQLYALCGLYLLDRQAYERSAEPFRKSTQKVYILSGTVGSTELVRDLFPSTRPTNFVEHVARSLKELSDKSTRK